MKTISALARVLILGVSLATASAQALVLLDTSTSGPQSITAADPTQLGRLSRNGTTPQDWSGSEVLTGIVGPTTTYYYATYLINVGTTPFIQVSFDSVSPNTFVSAYQTSYNPTGLGPNLGLDTNWLGDAAFSGNSFGTDTVFFQVTAALNSTIVIVVNTTPGGAGGLGDPFNLLVEGFIDTEFDDPPPPTVPEPATLLLSLVGLGALARQRMAKRG